MSYIGVQPTAGQYRQLDDISGSFNGATVTFTTSVGGLNVTAGSAEQLLVSLGGVIQNPGADYSVSTNSITFSTAPGSGLDFFAVLMGDAVNVGTPADGSVTSVKLASDLTVDLASGTVSAPSLTFDANTGLYSPGADQVAVATNGVERVEFGTSEVVFNDGGEDIDFRIEGDTEANLVFVDAGADTVSFRDDVYIDSSGRLLVGTSSASSIGPSLTSELQLETAGAASASIFGNANNPAGAYLTLGKSRGAAVGSNTIVQVNDELGGIYFAGADGSDRSQSGANIVAYVDGTPGANDMPGRLVFSTTADGSSSPTERMRITSGGFVRADNTGNPGNATQHSFNSNSQGSEVLVASSSNGSYNNTTGGILHAITSTPASSGFTFGGWYSNQGTDREFNFRGDGNGYCDGAWTGGGADYAEYFEWSDSNPDEDDRRGISVVLDGDTIRPALEGEDPIGVISGNPSVVGDAAWNKWNGKYLRDDFGTYIQEDYEVVNDEGETVIQQRRKLNPAYDPDQEYTPREQRPEWDCVGLMGKLRIRKGQPTGSRWIKMRDISDSVEEWLVR